MTAQCTAAESAQCSASDGDVGDQFGTSVGVSGNATIIGAPHDGDNGALSGSAYVHRSDGKTWTEQAKLVASDGAAEDYFGNAVAISGDVAVAGAYQNNGGAVFSGSAYVFQFDGVTWNEEQKLVALDAAPGYVFGWAVAADGNVVLVGALYSVASGFGYVFRYDGDSWVHEDKLIPSDGLPLDKAGYAVAISGSVAVLGAPFHDGVGEDSGAAYVFRFNGGNSWIEEAKLVASDGAADRQFGYSVSVSGDVVIVGAPTDSFIGNPDPGAAYVFHYDGAGWIEETRLVGSDSLGADSFGSAVAIDGDVIIVGAPAHTAAESDSGAAYTFEFDGAQWIETNKLVASDAELADVLGWSVAIDGGTGIAGAKDAEGSTFLSGAAYVYDGLPIECSCVWDLDGNASVSTIDLLILLAAWGSNPGGPPDFDGDGNVSTTDLLELLANWGPCT